MQLASSNLLYRKKPKQSSTYDPAREAAQTQRQPRREERVFTWKASVKCQKNNFDERDIVKYKRVHQTGDARRPWIVATLPPVI